MCIRKANKSGEILPDSYWNHPSWKTFFKQQITMAHALLRLYPYDAVLKALNDPKCKSIWSLGAKWLDDVIKIYDVKKEKVEETKIEVVSTTFKPRVNKGIRDE